MKKRILSLLAISLFALTSQAAEKKKLYKWVDENGNIHYSDEPHQGAEEIEIKEVPTVKMKTPELNLPKIIDPLDAGDKAAVRIDYYQTMALSEPSDDGVIRNNAGVITLTASLNPSLQEGHQIRFFLDGKPVSSDDPKALSATVEKAEFGEHSANFIVLDDKGNQLQASETIRFHLLHMINPNIRKNRNRS